MPRPTSGLSKDRQGSTFFELDPLADIHPTRTKICNAWEKLQLAIDELDPLPATDVCIELIRRLNELAHTKVRRAKNRIDDSRTLNHQHPQTAPGDNP